MEEKDVQLSRGRTLDAMGRAQAQGFNALLLEQNKTTSWIAAGQQLGNLGASQQQMDKQILNQLMAAVVSKDN